MASIDYSLNHLRSISSVEEADAIAKDAAASFKRATSSHGEATVKAAKAAYAAVSTGVLVTGKGATRQDHTVTGVEWGRRFDNLKGGGVSQATVNLWINLGMALVDFEVDPTSAKDNADYSLWQRLAFKGVGQRKEIRSVLDNKDATKADLLAAVREFVADDLKPVKRTPTPAGGEGQGGEGGEGGDGDVAPVQPLASSVNRATGAADVIATLVGDLSDEDFKSFLAAFKKASDAVKARGDKVPAKKAATPAKKTA